MIRKTGAKTKGSRPRIKSRVLPSGARYLIANTADINTATDVYVIRERTVSGNFGVFFDGGKPGPLRVESGRLADHERSAAAQHQQRQKQAEGDLLAEKDRSPAPRLHTT